MGGTRPEGRFTSADISLIDQYPSDPRSWNLYGYVRNNPLIYVDPTGRGCSWTTWFYSGPNGERYYVQSLVCSPDNDLSNVPGSNGAFLPGNNGSQPISAPPARSLMPDIDWGWWRTFTVSLTKGPSIGAGSCSEVFLNTAEAPLKKLQDTAKYGVPSMLGLMRAAPSAATWSMQQVSRMAAEGALDTAGAEEVIATVSTISAAALTAAPYVKDFSPAAILGGMDALMLKGVQDEVRAGFNGQCRF